MQMTMQMQMHQPHMTQSTNYAAMPSNPAPIQNVGDNPPSTTVWVGNVAPTVTEDEVGQAFGQFSRIREVLIPLNLINLISIRSMRSCPSLASPLS